MKIGKKSHENKKKYNIQLQKEFYSINDLKVNETQSVLSLYLYPKKWKWNLSLENLYG